MAQMKPKKTMKYSKSRIAGKKGPSKPGNRVASKGTPGGSTGPGLTHEKYMTPQPTYM